MSCESIKTEPQDDDSAPFLVPHLLVEEESAEPPKNFRCEQDSCCFSTDHPRSIRRHTTSFHTPTPCRQCSFIAEGTRGYAKHQMTEHAGPIIKMGRDPDEVFKCEHCSYTTKKKPHLAIHIKYKHLRADVQEMLPCTYCEYRAKFKHDLKKHIRNVHERPIEVTDWIVCELCSYKCSSKGYMTQHVKNVHTPEELLKWYFCQHCPYKAKKRSHVKEHEWMKHKAGEYKVRKEQTFLCELCPYQARYRTAITQHMQHVHISEENIIWKHCAQCSYRAKTASSLCHHVRNRHTAPENIRWFECKYCSYRTKYGYKALEKHMGKHGDIHVETCIEIKEEKVEKEECEGE